MSNKKVKVKIDLDFTSNKSSLEGIKKQLETAIKTVELNMEVNPKDKQKVINYIKEIDRLADASYNKSTQKINKKVMDAFMTSSDILPDMKTANKEMSQFGIVATKSFNDINNSNQLFNKSLKESDSTLTRMGTTLANTIRWNISSSVVNSFTGSIKSAYYFAKDLDRELTNIMIVSGESASNMKVFSQQANESAKALKVSTIEYAEAATLFYQQGLRGDDVTNMTDAAVMASNITGQAASDMSDLLTSTMNGYGMMTDEVLSITDKLSAVGATTASDFNELATGMSKVASMANAAGVDIDQLNGQLATIISTTRESPESIGMSLKTIYGRMLMFKNNTTKMMKDDDGEMFGVPSVEAALSKFSAATGDKLSLFNIGKDGTKELKDLGGVIEEIGNAWDKTSDKTAKFGLATALAGSRQQNRLIALFDSWDQYEDTVVTSLEAEGTTLKQNEIYMDSYEGRLKGLSAAKEGLFMAITEDSGGMKNFISGMTTAVELTTKVMETVGGISAIVGTVGGLLASMAVPKAFLALDNLREQGVDSKTKIGMSAEDASSYDDLRKIQKIFGDEKAEYHRKEIANHRESLQAQERKKDALFDERKALDNIIASLDKKTSIEKNGGDTKSLENMRAMNQERIRRMELERDQVIIDGGDASRLNLLIDNYQELMNVTMEAQDIQNNYGSEAAEVVDDKLQVLQERAEQLQEEINAIDHQVDQELTGSVKSANISNSELNTRREHAKTMADEAEKQMKWQQGINTAMRVGIPLISAAADTSKSGMDVFKTGLAMVSTLMPTIVGGFMALPTALAGATTAAQVFSGVMSTALGPIGIALGLATAVAGAIFVATKNTRDLKKAVEDVNEATEKREELENKRDQMVGQKSINDDRQKVLEDIGKDRTESEQQELEEIKKQNIELDRQIQLEGHLLEIEKEKESTAVLTLMAKKEESDIVATKVEAEYGGYTYPKMEKFKGTPAEEVEAIVKQLEEQEKLIEKINSDIDDTMADTTLSEKKKAKALEKLQKELKDTETAQKDGVAALSDKNKALKENYDKIGEVEGAEKDLKDAIKAATGVGDEYLDKFFDIIDAQSEAGEPIDDLTSLLSAQEQAVAKLTKLYDELSPKIFDLYETIQDPETPEYDRIKALEEMAEVYGELISMDLPEEFFREAKNMALLSEAINGSDEAFYQLQLNALRSAEYIEGIAISMNWTAKEVADMTGALDLLEFTVDGDLDATKFLKKMIEMGYTIEQAQQMLSELAGTEVQFDMTYQPIDFPVGELSAAQEQMAFRKHRQNVPKNLKGAIIKGGLGKSFNPFSAPSQDYGSKRPTRNKDGSKKEKPKKSSAGKKDKEVKEEKTVEADAYAQLTHQIERNSAAIEENNLMQEIAGNNFGKRMKLIAEEGKLYESRGKLLKNHSNQLINEAKLLQPQLQAIGIGFTGSWEDNSIVLSNLDKIDGKSQILGKKLERVQEIIKEMPSVTKDWWENWQKQQEVIIKQLDTIHEKYERQRKNLEWEDKKLENNIKKIEQSISIGGKDSKEHLTNIQKITNEMRKQQSIKKKDLEFQRLELKEVQKLISQTSKGKAKFVGSGENLRISNKTELANMNLPGLDKLMEAFNEIVITEIPKLTQDITDLRISIIENNDKILDSITDQIEALKELNSVRFDNHLDRISQRLDNNGRDEELLLFKFDLFDEQDFENKAAILGDLFESSKDNIDDYRREFERLSKITPTNADEASSLASALEEVQEGMRNAFTSTRDYQRQLEQMQFDAIANEFEQAGEQMNTFKSIIDMNLQSLEQGLLPDFSLDMVLPIPDFTGMFEEASSENERIFNETRDHEDQIRTLKRTSLNLQLKDAEEYYLKEQANIGNHYISMEEQIKAKEEELSNLRGSFSGKETEQLRSFIEGTKKMIDAANEQAVKDEGLYQKDTLKEQVKGHDNQFKQAASDGAKITKAQHTRQWTRLEQERQHQIDKQKEQEKGQSSQLASSKTHGATLAKSEKTDHEKLVKGTVDNWLDPEHYELDQHYVRMKRTINNRFVEILLSLESNYDAIIKNVQTAMDSVEGIVDKTLKKINTAIEAAKTLNEVSSSGATAPGNSGNIKSAFGGAYSKTSNYGMRKHPITGVKKMHTGVDLAASSGTPIPSQTGGTVTKAGWGGGYGNVVFVTQGNQQRVYAHMSSVGVKVGQTVKTGQVLGRVGSTGNSTGPHLHYEKRVNGRHVHPGYAKGTRYHPGGTALIGEEGHELGLLPSGRSVMLGIDGSEIVDLPAGTQVIPHKETKEILKHTGDIDGHEIPSYAGGTPGYKQAPIISATGKVDKTSYALTPWRERIEVIIQGDKAFTIDGGYVPEGYHLVKNGTDYKSIGARGRIIDRQEMYDYYRGEQSKAASEEGRDYYSNKANHLDWMGFRLSQTTRRDGLNNPTWSEGLFERYLDADTQLDLQRTGRLPDIPNFATGPSKDIMEGTGKYAEDRYSSIGFSGYDNYEKQRKPSLELINKLQKEYLKGLGSEQDKKEILSLIDEQILEDTRAQSLLAIDMAEQEKKNIDLFLEATKTRIDATEDIELKSLLIKQYNEALVDRQQAEQDLTQTIQRRYEMEFAALDKKLQLEKEYQEEVQYNLNMLDADDHENRVRLTQELIGLEEGYNASLKNSLKELERQLTLLPVGTQEWNILNQKAKDYTNEIRNSNLELKQMQEQLKQAAQEQLRKDFDKTFSKIEKELYDGKTEEQAREDFEHKLYLQGKYVEGAEKELEVSKIRNKIKKEELTLTEEQEKILNSTDKIERAKLERMEKELEIQRLQIKLDNLKEQKTIRQLKQNKDGSFDYQYVADENAIYQVEEELASKKVDLINWERDYENEKDRKFLEDKSKYLKKLNDIIQKALNGEYETTKEFRDAIDALNRDFMEKIDGEEYVSKWQGKMSAISPMLGELTNSFDAFLNKLEEIDMSGAFSTIARGLDTLIAMLKEKSKEMYEMGDRIGQSYLDGLTNSLEDIMNDKTLSEFEKHTEAMKKMGEAITEFGIIGNNGMVGFLFQAIQSELSDDPLKAMESYLDSKANDFKISGDTIGESVIEGFQNGISGLSSIIDSIMEDELMDLDSKQEAINDAITNVFGGQEGFNLIGKEGGRDFLEGLRGSLIEGRDDVGKATSGILSELEGKSKEFTEAGDSQGAKYTDAMIKSIKELGDSPQLSDVLDVINNALDYDIGTGMLKSTFLEKALSDLSNTLQEQGQILSENGKAAGASYVEGLAKEFSKIEGTLEEQQSEMLKQLKSDAVDFAIAGNTSGLEFTTGLIDGISDTNLRTEMADMGIKIRDKLADSVSDLKSVGDPAGAQFVQGLVGGIDRIMNSDIENKTEEIFKLLDKTNEFGTLGSQLGEGYVQGMIDKVQSASGTMGEGDGAGTLMGVTNGIISGLQAKSSGFAQAGNLQGVAYTESIISQLQKAQQSTSTSMDDIVGILESASDFDLGALIGSDEDFSIGVSFDIEEPEVPEIPDTESTHTINLVEPPPFSMPDSSSTHTVNVVTKGSPNVPGDTSSNIKAFDTGGYTGDFSGGRLGILHQKERVLSAEQTASFEKLVHDMPSMFKSMERLPNIVGRQGGFSVPNKSSQSQEEVNHYHIGKLEFPGVQNSKEIQDAIDSLELKTRQKVRK